MKLTFLQNLFLAVLFVAIGYASNSHAHGVEKILPADATNIRITNVQVVWVGVGSYYIANTPSEGPQSEIDFAKRLAITVKYQSKDDTDAPKSGSGFDGSFAPGDDLSPSVTFNFELSPGKLAEVEAGKVNPVSLVKMANPVMSVVMNDPNYQYKCEYSYEYNTKVDPNCHEQPSKITEVRPVLTLEVQTN